MRPVKQSRTSDNDMKFIGWSYFAVISFHLVLETKWNHGCTLRRLLFSAKVREFHTKKTKKLDSLRIDNKYLRNASTKPQTMQTFSSTNNPSFLHTSLQEHISLLKCKKRYPTL